MTNIVQTWAWFGLATLAKGADWVTRQDNEMIRLGSNNKIIRWKAISNGPFLYCHWRQEASQGWDLQELINIFACLKRGSYWQGIILLSRSCVKPFFELSFEIFCAFQKMPLPLLFHPLLETLWIRLTLGLTVKATVSAGAHNLSCDHLMGGARSSKELRYPSFEVPITLGFFRLRLIETKHVDWELSILIWSPGFGRHGWQLLKELSISFLFQNNFQCLGQNINIWNHMVRGK